MCGKEPEKLWEVIKDIVKSQNKEKSNILNHVVVVARDRWKMKVANNSYKWDYKIIIFVERKNVHCICRSQLHWEVKYGEQEFNYQIRKHR